MQNESKSKHQAQQELYEQLRETNLRHWRAWGSWFSWGSPVGLGLFFISIAATLWILAQAFGWK